MDHHSQISNLPNVTHGLSQRQRRAGEDLCAMAIGARFSYFSVFDGHGGPYLINENHVVDFCAKSLHQKLHNALKDVDDEKSAVSSIKYAFLELDAQMHGRRLSFGTTCTTVIIDRKKGLIYQVNLGDSRSILFTREKILSETKDHCPTAAERERIEKAGSSVNTEHKRLIGPFGGALAVSRSFGDFLFKRNTSNHVDYDPVFGPVSAVPDVTITHFKDNLPLYCILTSDAPFERHAFNNQTLVYLFNATKDECGDDLNKIAREMVERITPLTEDDTTILLLCID